MARQLANWIDSYMTLVEQTEPHPRYHLWVAITILAAAMGRKVEVKFGPELLFPNFYTVLVGPAANKKSTAIRYGKELLEKASCVKIAPAGRVTDQKLYEELEDTMQAIQINGEPFVHHTMLVIASELVMFLGESKGGKRSDDRLADVCDLYDGGNFSYRTKQSGCNAIANPGLYLLGATTPQWITTSMPMLAIAGGPTSRMLFIYSASVGKLISLTEMPSFDQQLEAQLIHDLREIAALKGRFTVDKTAKAAYTDWYKNVYPKLDLQDQRLESYLGRLPIILIKTALVISASRSNDMILSEQDFLTAVKYLNNANKHMSRSFGHMGHNLLGPQTELVRDLIERKGNLKRSEILTSLRMHINMYDYNRIMETLCAEGYCTVKYNNTGDVEVVKL